MILVDTNVLSQPLRPDGDTGVVAWIDRYYTDIRVPTLVVSELIYGAHMLHDRQQRDRLALRIDLLLARFANRFVTFDLAAARRHGQIAGECQRVGRRLTPVDGRIAAMAIELEASVATRNVSDFAPTGVAVIDPWTA